MSCNAVLRCAVLCCVSSCVVPSCVVVCCGVFFGAVWCRGALWCLVVWSAVSCCIVLVVSECPALPLPLPAAALVVGLCPASCRVVPCFAVCGVLCCTVLVNLRRAAQGWFGMCCVWCLVLWCVAMCYAISFGVLWCGGVTLLCGVVCRGALLPRAVSCGVVLPCGAVLSGSCVLFPLLLLPFSFSPLESCFSLPLKIFLKNEKLACFLLCGPALPRSVVRPCVAGFLRCVLPGGGVPCRPFAVVFLHSLLACTIPHCHVI